MIGCCIRIPVNIFEGNLKIEQIFIFTVHVLLAYLLRELEIAYHKTHTFGRSYVLVQTNV